MNLARSLAIGDRTSIARWPQGPVHQHDPSAEAGAATLPPLLRVRQHRPAGQGSPAAQRGKGRRPRLAPPFSGHVVLAGALLLSLPLLLSQPEPFDVVTCMFAVHYFFVTEARQGGLDVGMRWSPFRVHMAAFSWPGGGQRDGPRLGGGCSMELSMHDSPPKKNKGFGPVTRLAPRHWRSRLEAGALLRLAGGGIDPGLSSSGSNPAGLRQGLSVQRVAVAQGRGVLPGHLSLGEERECPRLSVVPFGCHGNAWSVQRDAREQRPPLTSSSWMRLGLVSALLTQPLHQPVALDSIATTNSTSSRSRGQAALMCTLPAKHR